MKKKRRVPVRVSMQKQLLIESGGKCGWCKKTAPSFDFHHIDSDPSRTVQENLIPLCGTCHDGARLGNPSQADLGTRKLELTWIRNAAQCHEPTSAPGSMFTATGNFGPVQQAQKITNHFNGNKTPSLAPAADSIGAHAAERSYIEYLRKEYIRCRLLEQKYGDHRHFTPPMTKNIIIKALGYAPLQAPMSAFDVTWRKLHALVTGTLGATKYQSGFRPHGWEDHQMRFRAKPRT